MIRVLQLGVVFSLSFAATAFFLQGGITVTPAAPLSGQAITIRVANSFGAHATLESATISRSGNTFSIVQNVNLACTLPLNPLVASEFQLGPLPAGTYNVVAQINFVDVDPADCAAPPVTQAATFDVTYNAIPFLDPSMLCVFAVVLGVAGALAIRR